MPLEEIAIGKLGIIGVLLVGAVKAIHMLWAYGERKSDIAGKERDALRDERNDLRAERTEMRNRHHAEVAALHAAHAADIARVRAEAAQQISEVRASTNSRYEELLVEVTRFTSSFEPMLAKLFERVRPS
jgi:predicted  nucleic acid-binding Zn-ribbon protein